MTHRVSPPVDSYVALVKRSYSTGAVDENLFRMLKAGIARHGHTQKAVGRPLTYLERAQFDMHVGRLPSSYKADLLRAAKWLDKREPYLQVVTTLRGKGLGEKLLSPTPTTHAEKRVRDRRLTELFRVADYKRAWAKVPARDKRYTAFSYGYVGTKKKRGLGGIEADELRLYIDNEAALYGQYQSIRKNLCKKRKKGTYDHAKAPKLFKYLVDRGAKRYACEFATCRDWNKIFTVAERNTCAREMADDFKQTSCSEWGFGKVRGRR